MHWVSLRSVAVPLLSFVPPAAALTLWQFTHEPVSPSSGQATTTDSITAPVNTEQETTSWRRSSRDEDSNDLEDNTEGESREPFEHNIEGGSREEPAATSDESLGDARTSNSDDSYSAQGQDESEEEVFGGEFEGWSRDSGWLIDRRLIRRWRVFTHPALGFVYPGPSTSLFDPCRVFSSVCDAGRAEVSGVVSNGSGLSIGAGGSGRDSSIGSVQPAASSRAAFSQEGDRWSLENSRLRVVIDVAHYCELAVFRKLSTTTDASVLSDTFRFLFVPRPRPCDIRRVSSTQGAAVEMGWSGPGWWQRARIFVNNDATAPEAVIVHTVTDGMRGYVTRVANLTGERFTTDLDGRNVFIEPGQIARWVSASPCGKCGPRAASR